MSFIRGTSDKNNLNGTSNADVIYCFAGDDQVGGDEGDDILYGDQGNDSLRGDGGTDYLFGNQGDDYLEGGDGDDVLIGGQGNDILKGDLGRDYFTANLGDDSLEGTLEDTLSGGMGADTFFVSQSGNTVLEKATVITDFGQGNDVFQGLNGVSFLSQGSVLDLANIGTNASSLKISQGTGIYANDVIIQDNNNQDFIAVLKNIQVVSTNATTVVTSSPIANPDFFTTSSLIVGTSNADLISASAPGLFNNQILPVTTLLANDLSPSGNPFVITQVSNPVNGNVLLTSSDVIFTPTVPLGGGSFNYTISDGSLTGSASVTVTIQAIQQISGLGENDTIIGSTNDDSLDGGTENDTLFSGPGNDILLGGLGNDTLDGGTEDDSLDGGEGDDLILGYLGSDSLLGGGGNDVLVGELGNNTLDGGTGDDSLYAGNDNDTLSGGIGDDSLLGYSGDDTLDGGIGNDFLQGGVGVAGDSLDGNDLILGDLGDDTLLGDYGSDTLVGGEDNDFVQGGIGSTGILGDGSDSLLGGHGDDTIYGDDGSDTLIGDLGADIFKGGAGNDSFIYLSPLDGDPGEIIEDFHTTDVDLILLNATAFGFLSTGILSSSNYATGPSLLVAEASLASSPGLLGIDNGSGGINVFYDNNGSTPGGTQSLFTLQNVSLSSFTQNNFLLF